MLLNYIGGVCYAVSHVWCLFFLFLSPSIRLKACVDSHLVDALLCRCQSLVWMLMVEVSAHRHKLFTLVGELAREPTWACLRSYQAPSAPSAFQPGTSSCRALALQPDVPTVSREHASPVQRMPLIMLAAKASGDCNIQHKPSPSSSSLHLQNVNSFRIISESWRDSTQLDTKGVKTGRL